MKIKISEITELKIKNCNLTLQLLQVHMNQVLSDRERIILEEFNRLGCNPGEWYLDENTFELCKRTGGEANLGAERGGM